MKSLSKTILYLTLSIVLSSCSQSIVNPTATLSPIPTTTLRPTAIPIVTINPTATIIPYPTIIPTINPTELSNLLQSSFSVARLDGLNGHRLRRVTGWTNGFKKDYGWVDNFQGYQWMDSNHLLLLPIVGETQSPNWSTIIARAIVLNLETGKTWLPPSDLPDPGFTVLRFLLPRWSPEAGVLITAENIGSGNAVKEGVTTFKSDGTFVAHYEGRLTSVSPSGNKILIADDSWIDLISGKKVEFMWDDGTYTPRWRPAWSLDENQIYSCCYFYGNAKTDKSYALNDGNTTIYEGGSINKYQSLHHSGGLWLNETYVLADGDSFYSYITNFESNVIIFDPSERTFRNLSKIASLPDELNGVHVIRSISPNRDYMWMGTRWGLNDEPIDPIGYLIDIKTLKSHFYPAAGLAWSANGKYATIGLKVLSLSKKELKELPANKYCDAWHPIENVCSSISVNEQKIPTLILQDVQNMSVKKIALPASFSSSKTIWSPTGNHVALIAEDNSLWQIDYPNLENLEQVTPSMPNMNINSIIWSPDETYLSFFIGTDIYIVDANNNP